MLWKPFKTGSTEYVKAVAIRSDSSDFPSAQSLDCAYTAKRNKSFWNAKKALPLPSNKYELTIKQP